MLRYIEIFFEKKTLTLETYGRPIEQIYIYVYQDKTYIL